MTDNKNVLKGKCREILDTEDKVTRYAKRVDLRRWIKDEKTEITMQMIKELDYEELGIFMICGAGGDYYTYARRLREDKKGDLPKTAEDQPTEETKASDVTPCYDETKGFEQIVPNVLVSMIHNSSDEVLDTVGLALCEEVDRRAALSDRGTG